MPEICKLQQGLMGQAVENSTRDNGVNLPPVEFATPPYPTHRFERRLYEKKVLDFSEPS
jgi:hypothetical protein